LILLVPRPAAAELSEILTLVFHDSIGRDRT